MTATTASNTTTTVHRTQSIARRNVGSGDVLALGDAEAIDGDLSDRREPDAEAHALVSGRGGVHVIWRHPGAGAEYGELAQYRHPVTVFK